MRLTSTKKRVITEEVIETIICDRCKQSIASRTEEGSWSNIVGIQEMHSIHFMGGFGSLFGDGAIVKADICQTCLYELIKDFAEISYE